jgi:translation elongation factor EF-G
MAVPEDIRTQPLVVELAIEPKSKAGREKLAIALAKLAAEDPWFEVSTCHESGQTIIKGTSESLLVGKIDILRRIYRIEANVGAPQVAYRETITRTVEQDYTYKKQTGGTGQFARVKIRFEPLPAGSGFEFENGVVGGAVPREFVPGVEKGLTLQRDTGVIAGFPVIDFKATLIDGAYHDVDSNVLTFDIAARACFREGIPKAGPKLLEPVMRVDVVTPEEYIGNIIGDLNSRCGHIGGMDTQGNARRPGDGPARQHARLREQPTLDEPWARRVRNAVRSLCSGSGNFAGRRSTFSASDRDACLNGALQLRSARERTATAARLVGAGVCLHAGFVLKWRTRRDSNSRPLPSEGSALSS